MSIENTSLQQNQFWELRGEIGIESETPGLSSKGFESMLKNYNIVKNVENIRDASIVCLGETHFCPTHQKNNAAIIDTLYRPGDVVLVEEAARKDDSVIHSVQTAYVTKNIKVKGWDCSSEYVNSKPITSQLTSQQTNASNFQVSYAIFASPVALISTIAVSLFFGLGALATTALGVSLFACSTLPLVAQASVAGLKDRNEHMCKIIEENKTEKNKIFVLAGAYHFEEVSKNAKRWGYDTTSSIEVLKNYLKDKKFAILTPK